MIKYDNPMPFTIDQAEVYQDLRLELTKLYDWTWRELTNVWEYEAHDWKTPCKGHPWTPQYNIQKVWKHALYHEWAKETFKRPI